MRLTRGYKGSCRRKWEGTGKDGVGVVEVHIGIGQIIGRTSVLREAMGTKGKWAETTGES